MKCYLETNYSLAVLSTRRNHENISKVNTQHGFLLKKKFFSFFINNPTRFFTYCVTISDFDFQERPIPFSLAQHNLSISISFYQEILKRFCNNLPQIWGEPFSVRFFPEWTKDSFCVHVTLRRYLTHKLTCASDPDSQ